MAKVPHFGCFPGVLREAAPRPAAVQPIFFMYEAPAAAVVAPPRRPPPARASRPHDTSLCGRASGDLRRLASLWSVLSREVPRGAHTRLVQAAEEFALAAMATDSRWRRGALQSVLRELDRQHVALATRLSRDRAACPHALAARNRIVLVKQRVRQAMREAVSSSGEMQHHFEESQPDRGIGGEREGVLLGLQQFKYHGNKGQRERDVGGASGSAPICSDDVTQACSSGALKAVDFLEEFAYGSGRSRGGAVQERPADVRRPASADVLHTPLRGRTRSAQWAAPRSEPKSKHRAVIVRPSRASGPAGRTRTGLNLERRDNASFRAAESRPRVKVSCFFVATRRRPLHQHVPTKTHSEGPAPRGGDAQAHTASLFSAAKNPSVLRSRFFATTGTLRNGGRFDA
jgi:hypothetical protein